MSNKDFNKEVLIDFWLKSSDGDFDTMIVLFENKKYNWSLFVGHLLIEKLLKALYVKTKNDYPPLIHNLLRLAEKCDLYITEEQKLFLITITAFNINTRYDDYKMSFQQVCTPEYSKFWIEEIKNRRLWIKKLIAQ